MIRDLTAQRQAFRAKMDELRGLMVPGKDPGWAISARHSPPGGHPAGTRSCSLPRPQITPSAKILQLAAEHDTEPEAGD